MCTSAAHVPAGVRVPAAAAASSSAAAHCVCIAHFAPCCQPVSANQASTIRSCQLISYLAGFLIPPLRPDPNIFSLFQHY
jgi:hypothetical protein